MYGYIYKTTDLRNNKIYVGQHKAKTFDDKYFGSGIVIQQLLQKYGTSIFKCEVLCECINAEELNEKEIFFIEKLHARDASIGYNIAFGGAFGDSGYHLGMLGKKQSIKQREAARKANSYKRNAETRAKMSEAARGNSNAKGHKGACPMKGKHHTEETKRILSEKLSSIVTETHRNRTPEQRALRGSHISAAKKGKICITDGFKNYYIHESEWPDYAERGFYKMSKQKLMKLKTM